MGIFSKKRITLIVREFEVNSSATDNDPLLRIRGHRKGFLFWILRILGLKDPSVELLLTKDKITTILSNREHHFLPTKQIHSYFVSKAKKKIWVVLSVLA